MIRCPDSGLCWTDTGYYPGAVYRAITRRYDAPKARPVVVLSDSGSHSAWVMPITTRRLFADGRERVAVAAEWYAGLDKESYLWGVPWSVTIRDIAPSVGWLAPIDARRLVASLRYCRWDEPILSNCDLALAEALRRDEVDRGDMIAHDLWGVDVVLRDLERGGSYPSGYADRSGSGRY